MDNAGDDSGPVRLLAKLLMLSGRLLRDGETLSYRVGASVEEGQPVTAENAALIKDALKSWDRSYSEYHELLADLWLHGGGKTDK